jgi:hypothetical protein
VISAAFAESRNKLLFYGITDKIDINDRFFIALYNLNTFFMRRPEQYEAMFTPIMDFRVMLSLDSKQQKQEQESVKLSPELKEVFNKTSQALDKIVIQYSSLIKLLNYIWGVIRGSNESFKIENKPEVITKEKRKMELNNLIEGTKKDVGDLVMA